MFKHKLVPHLRKYLEAFPSAAYLYTTIKLELHPVGEEISTSILNKNTLQLPVPTLSVLTFWG